jgi:hypothetical protein
MDNLYSKIERTADRNRKKFSELEALAKPLQDWMMENYCMMNKIEITCDGVTVLSPELFTPMKAKGL